MARLGTALLMFGIVTVGLGALWQIGLVPGSRVTLPEPVALTRRASTAPLDATAPTPATLPGPAAHLADPGPGSAGRPTSEPLGAVATLPAPAPISAPLGEAAALPGAPAIVAADAAERAQARPREMGYAVRLAIPSIKLDTVVDQAGIVPDADGNPEWQTLPFVAVHYGDLTSLIGGPGNAVIAGHVVTLNAGNVFRFLYQLDLDDQVQVWDDHAAEHDYRVVAVKLVRPSDTSVMAPSAHETLTLITCGGTFDPVKREFSDRLIVTAVPL